MLYVVVKSSFGKPLLIQQSNSALIRSNERVRPAGSRLTGGVV